MKYKSGDVVIKKSGGNKMTIEKINDTECKCVWFVGAKVFEKIFNTEELTTVEEYERIYIKKEMRDDKINQLLKS